MTVDEAIAKLNEFGVRCGMTLTPPPASRAWRKDE